MRIPLFAYIALGLLLSVFAYGYLNYPSADQADRFQSYSNEGITYCNSSSALKKANCLVKRAARQADQDR